MNDILAARHGALLEKLAQSNVLLAFDFDGTLAPIVDQPDDARLTEETRSLLEGLTRRYPCVLISGRTQSDVLKRVRGIGFHEVIGNHGLEPWRRMLDVGGQVQPWIAPLEALVARFEGAVLEDKHFSLAVHFRHVEDKKAFRDSLIDVIRGFEEVRVIGGKEVVNLLPEAAPHKGTALQAARERHGCDVALYVGDDETDEDVFRLEEPGKIFGIRVGDDPASLAQFTLESQAEVDGLLRTLLQLRPEERLLRRLG